LFYNTAVIQPLFNTFAFKTPSIELCIKPL